MGEKLRNAWLEWKNRIVWRLLANATIVRHSDISFDSASTDHPLKAPSAAWAPSCLQQSLTRKEGMYRWLSFQWRLHLHELSMSWQSVIVSTVPVSSKYWYCNRIISTIVIDVMQHSTIWTHDPTYSTPIHTDIYKTAYMTVRQKSCSHFWL